MWRVSMSSISTGPTRGVLTNPGLGGVAQPTFTAQAPSAPATNVQATSLSVFQLIVIPPIGLRYQGKTTRPARRPSAGAVPDKWGACLAVRTPPAAWYYRYVAITLRG